MTMRLRAKFGLAVAGVVGVLALAAAAAPYLLDVEQFKPALVKAVKDATGRELVIEGPMKLSMFPRPQISARHVRFANAAGSIGAQMVDVSWVGASPSWPALMRGDFEIGRLTLARPTIVLETDAQGRPNWEFAPGAAAAQPAGAPSTGLHLAIGRLRIVDGTVSYTDPQTGKTLKAEKVDLTASVQSFQGPLAMKGSATVNDVPLALEFSMGAPLQGGHDVVSTAVPWTSAAGPVPLAPMPRSAACCRWQPASSPTSSLPSCAPLARRSPRSTHPSSVSSRSMAAWSIRPGGSP